MSHVEKNQARLLIKIKDFFVSRVSGSCRCFTRDRRPEDGRSMVEMLGVLSIIGVLTLVSLLGYQYAVIKNETNNLIDRGSKFAVSCSIFLYKNPDENCQFIVGELNLPNGGTAEMGTNVFSLTVPNTQKKVCQMVNETVWPMLWNLLRDGLSGEEIDVKGENCSDDMDLTMVFARDLALEEEGQHPNPPEVTDPPDITDPPEVTDPPETTPSDPCKDIKCLPCEECQSGTCIPKVVPVCQKCDPDTGDMVNLHWRTNCDGTPYGGCRSGTCVDLPFPNGMTSAGMPDPPYDLFSCDDAPRHLWQPGTTTSDRKYLCSLCPNRSWDNTGKCDPGIGGNQICWFSDLCIYMGDI